MMKLSSIIFTALLLTVFGCMQEPDDGERTKYMVVQTEYDTASINDGENVFNTYSTFFIQRDTIGYVYNDPNADTVLIDGVHGVSDYVTPVVNKIIGNTQAVGFNYVGQDANPDFAIKASVLQNFSYYQTVSYPYYSGYYGYYGSYYPVVNTYSSNSATFLIEIIDIKNYADNGNKYVVVWRAYIGDLISTLDLKGRTLEAIDKAFEQSPYINGN
jgi:hypothetical protein